MQGTAKPLESIKQVLKKNSLRITQSRLNVARVLSKNNSTFLAAEEIHQEILSSQNDCDLASVYRILNTFTEIKIAERNQFQGEGAKYRLSDKKHQHYFKCRSCGGIEPFSGCMIKNKEKELFENGYRELKHHLEITGLCPSCC